MTRIFPRALLLATLLAPALAPAPTLAAERPAAMPTRDVDVTYDIPTPAGMARQRLRFSQALQSFRIDPPGGGLYVVVDQAKGRMFTVRDADRAVIDMAAPRAWMPGINASGFERGAATIVAGLACTEWTTRDSERRNVRLCMTEDGVMLRAQTTSGEALATATTVQYQQQNANVFHVPPDYRRLAPPPLPQAR